MGRFPGCEPERDHIPEEIEGWEPPPDRDEHDTGAEDRLSGGRPSRWFLQGDPQQRRLRVRWKRRREPGRGPFLSDSMEQQTPLDQPDATAPCHSGSRSGEEDMKTAKKKQKRKRLTTTTTTTTTTPPRTGLAFSGQGTTSGAAPPSELSPLESITIEKVSPELDCGRFPVKRN